MVDGMTNDRWPDRVAGGPASVNDRAASGSGAAWALRRSETTGLEPAAHLATRTTAPERVEAVHAWPCIALGDLDLKDGEPGARCAGQEPPGTVGNGMGGVNRRPKSWQAKRPPRHGQCTPETMITRVIIPAQRALTR